MVFIVFIAPKIKIIYLYLDLRLTIEPIKNASRVSFTLGHFCACLE